MAVVVLVGLLAVMLAWQWSIRRWVRTVSRRQGRRVYAAREWLLIAVIVVVACGLNVVAAAITFALMPFAVAFVMFLIVGSVILVGSMKLFPTGSPTDDRRPRSPLVEPHTWTAAVASAACFGGVLVGLGVIAQRPGTVVFGIGFGGFLLVRFYIRRRRAQ